MKKTFTLLFAILCAVSMMAKNYVGTLGVIVNDGDPTYVDNQSITVEKQADGKYHMSIANFSLGIIKVGTIDVKNIKAVDGSGHDALSYNAPITISQNADGSDAIMAGMTMDMNYVGIINDNFLIMSMQIDASDLGQVIDVEFKSNDCDKFMSIPNGGFEEFHNQVIKGTLDRTKNADEPNGWHSFMAASGSQAWLAASVGDPHTHISDVVRPGSTGIKSIMLTSTNMSLFGIANGTMTTGRLNAGKTTASDKSNNAYIDLTKTDLDDNGDPFYTLMNLHPDALKVWVKFKQKETVTAHPYATINAVITDGTYYQDPEDKTYNNVVGKATNKTIESKNFEWQELVIPFDYETYKANNVEPRAILVTVSTNADPGCGSSDTLYVDDMELVYNAGLKSLKYKGADVAVDGYYGTVTIDGEYSIDDFTAEAEGHDAIITMKIEQNYDEKTGKTTDALQVTVLSVDMTKMDTYTIDILGGSVTGLTNTAITMPNGISAIYTVSGQKVSSMQPGKAYIVKYSNGETKTVLK